MFGFGFLVLVIVSTCHFSSIRMLRSIVGEENSAFSAGYHFLCWTPHFFALLAVASLATVIYLSTLLLPKCGRACLQTTFLHMLVGEFLLVVCILTRPTGSPKYGTTRKNTQRHYATKHLIRYMYSTHPWQFFCKQVSLQKTKQLKLNYM